MTTTSPLNHILIATSVAKLSCKDADWDCLSDSMKSSISDCLFRHLPKEFIMESTAMICEKIAQNELPEFNFSKDGRVLTVIEKETTTILPNQNISIGVKRKADELEKPVIKQENNIIPQDNEPLEASHKLSKLANGERNSMFASKIMDLLSSNNQKNAKSEENKSPVLTSITSGLESTVSGSSPNNDPNYVADLCLNACSDDPNTENLMNSTSTAAQLQFQNNPNFSHFLDSLKNSTHKRFEPLEVQSKQHNPTAEANLPDILPNLANLANNQLLQNLSLQLQETPKIDNKKSSSSSTSNTTTKGRYIAKNDLNAATFGMYKCRFCNHQSRRKQGIIDHERKHGNTFNFACHLCDFKSKQHSGMKNHIYKAHNQKFDVNLVKKICEPVPEGTTKSTNAVGKAPLELNSHHLLSNNNNEQNTGNTDDLDDTLDQESNEDENPNTTCESINPLFLQNLGIQLPNNNLIIPAKSNETSKNPIKVIDKNNSNNVSVITNATNTDSSSSGRRSNFSGEGNLNGMDGFFDGDEKNTLQTALNLLNSKVN